MKTVFFGLLILIGALVSGQADEKKVAALPPHPLDSAFEKAKTEKAINEGLLNNDHYKKAVREALKRKQEQEEMFRKNPKFSCAEEHTHDRKATLDYHHGVCVDLGLFCLPGNCHCHPGPADCGPAQ
jgi:hypothetical protein